MAQLHKRRNAPRKERHWSKCYHCPLARKLEDQGQGQFSLLSSLLISVSLLPGLPGLGGKQSPSSRTSLVICAHYSSFCHFLCKVPLWIFPCLCPQVLPSANLPSQRNLALDSFSEIIHRNSTSDLLMDTHSLFDLLLTKFKLMSSLFLYSVRYPWILNFNLIVFLL